MLRATTSHALHLLMEGVVGLIGLAAIAGCVLAWRLAQGPIDLTSLARRELFRVPAAGAVLSVGQAQLAWEGFRAPGSPLDIRWRDLTITTAAGGTLAHLPAGHVSLAAGPLLFGQLVPRAIELDEPSLSFVRTPEAGLRLGFAPPQETTAPSGVGLMQDLARPLGTVGTVPALSQLRRILIRDARVTIRDEALHITWHAGAPFIDLTRAHAGGVTGEGSLNLALGRASLSLSLVAGLSSHGDTDIQIGSTALAPAVLAGAAPVFAPLAALDAPLAFALQAELNPDLSLSQALLALQAGAGRAKIGTGQVALAGAEADLATDGNTIHLTNLRITQQPAAGTRLPPPTLTGAADLAPAAKGWHAGFNIRLDRVAFADLPTYWPPGTGGGARPWVTANITAGTAMNGNVSGTLDASQDLSGITLASLSGGIDATDMTLYWLRPVPPLEHAAGRLVIDGPDALHILVSKAAQGPLALSQGRINITGLEHKDQLGDISLTADGGVRPILELLNHPRLKLLSRRPISLQDPAGTATVGLRVTLPLDVRVTMAQIGVNAKAKLTDVHLSAIAAGRDLDHGQLDLKVDSNALNITGTGDVGGVPATLGLDMDFRNGPPDQVLEHMTASGHPTAAQLAGAGLPWMSGGTADLGVEYADRRDGTGSVDLRADLRNAAMQTPFGWNKGQGDAASASGTLRLLNGHLTGIDNLRAKGPGLDITSHANISPGQPSTLVLDRLQLGRTTASGTVSLPRDPKNPIRVALRGPTLDISAALKPRETPPTPEEEKREDEAETRPGQPWDADLKFGQVILAKDESLAPLSLTATSDGLHIQRAAVTAGTRGEVQASIVPAPGGRRLNVDSADAGAVLLAGGVADNIRGGKLKLDATYNDRVAHSPLSGTGTMSDFRITGGPAMGRLLEAMTLYGALDLLRGPGLGFRRAVVPFRWQQHDLHLESARAFSASLGITAQGDIDLRHHIANVQGTIVPAYFFNTLLGEIPLIGRVFSPEKGGGVFAARYSVTGPLKNPHVGVNPLSALTPGFLRGVFGLL